MANLFKKVKEQQLGKSNGKSMETYGFPKRFTVSRCFYPVAGFTF